MDGDLTTLFLGAVIAIVSSIVTYWVNHLLSVREQRLKREFEKTEKGRDFFHQIYGIVATLSDMATPFLIEDDSDNLMILIEKGYTMLPKKEIIKRYKQNYEKCSKLWYESREKGFEVFVTEESGDLLRKFWAYAGYFYETEDWEKDKDVIKRFGTISRQFCNQLDKILGLTERKSRIPKWLNPKNWRRIIWSEKV
jgi:hypothetical protein